VRQQKLNERYASFYAFVNNFLKCDSISMIWHWPAGNANAAKNSLTLSGIVATCGHPNWVVCFDNL
jgi:hypothetical protein